MSHRTYVYDPGGTTGYAIFRRSRGGMYVLEEHGEFETYTRLNDQIPKAQLVVYEEVTALHPSFNTVAIEVMGAIRALCLYNSIPSRARSPGTIKGFMRWKKGKMLRVASPHARDAIAHGVMLLGLDRVDLSQIWGSELNQG